MKINNKEYNIVILCGRAGSERTKYKQTLIDYDIKNKNCLYFPTLYTNERNKNIMQCNGINEENANNLISMLNNDQLLWDFGDDDYVYGIKVNDLKEDKINIIMSGMASALEFKEYYDLNMPIYCINQNELTIITNIIKYNSINSNMSCCPKISDISAKKYKKDYITFYNNYNEFMILDINNIKSDYIKFANC